MARQRLTAEDYAAMSVAAAELARMSTNPIRRRYNEALSVSYRASSLRTSAATEGDAAPQVVETV
jgi:hypothetical protein